MHQQYYISDKMFLLPVSEFRENTISIQDMHVITENGKEMRKVNHEFSLGSHKQVYIPK